jgi:predicted dienelactone hydrolase
VAAVYDAISVDAALAGCIDPDAGYAIVGHSFGGWTAIATAGATIDLDFLTVACGPDRGWLCQLLLPENAGIDPDLHDPRTWASVPMAPAGYETFGPDGMAGVDVPTLILGADNDAITPWEEHQLPMWEALTTDVRLAAQLEGATHYTFSDACRLAPVSPFCDGDIDLDEAHALINGMTTAFLEEVRGTGRDTSAWLGPDDPRVVWLEP